MNLQPVKSTIRSSAIALFLLSFTSPVLADGQAGSDTSRGKLLYSLHCISCHNQQPQWLANKKAADWPSLLAQVKLWQNVANLKWDNNDIESVARHLNTLYYHYPVADTVARKK